MKELLHLFVPNNCVSCNAALGLSVEIVCRRCQASFDSLATPAMADQLVRSILERHHDLRPGPVELSALYRFHRNDALQNVIHAMKYQGVYRAASWFGYQLAVRFGEQLGAAGIDVIVPVPLHALKTVERTYNQSTFIARALGRELGLQVMPGFLKRTRYTASQTGLSAAERHRNVEGAFSVQSGYIPSHVLLVDDVLTTGSTVTEAMRTLMSAGVRHVSLAIVAVAATG
ncbi:ComF family protein [Prosthecochloris sp. HL-130-GSB]|jgi:ComF family protein|uniref:ComF family protein n=1 Tax=Prosthecochloris sp. HL-130-GSB TaxID=1974213 RepID=UPI000A1C110C|nr:ComF family protein [Prosthecochloris sp. HL-130-GSB]ARM31573.1 hypothetical protein B9H02_10030 [Prosthecochloris sp. HL-130-GSB]MBO8092990.1 ComF family protein [Prosthecochloris sp.]